MRLLAVSQILDIFGQSSINYHYQVGGFAGLIMLLTKHDLSFTATPRSVASR